MKVRLLLTATTAVVALGLLVGVASATPNTKVDLFQDVGAAGGVNDFAGPTGYGFFNYNLDEAGTLRVVAALKNAKPNTAYGIYLTCGPTHAAACGFVQLGSFTTDADGNANSGAINLESPYAGGPDDHVDIIGGGEVYAGGIVT